MALVRLLVTGGSGFVGRNLVEHLARTHEVLAPTHAELELTDDHAVREWFARHEVDAVVHGAVRPGHRAAADPSRQLWSNLRMFFNLIACGDRYERLVFLSSGAAYDTRQPLVRVGEDRFGASIPEDEHGLSKYVAGAYLESRAAGIRPKVVELRLFGVFGRYEDYGIRFISNAICRTLYGLAVTLRQDRRFSYLFIDDLMPVVDWALADAPEKVACNVAPDWTDGLRDLAALVARQAGERLGKEVPVLVANEGTGKEYSADNTRLKEIMPNVSFTPTEIAVERLFSWYEDRLPELDRKRLVADR